MSAFCSTANPSAFPHLNKHGGIDICPALPDVAQVNEPAGTYLWHDHSSQLRADGLQGALIVHAVGGQAAEPWTYDEEQTLLLSDWFHGKRVSIVVLVAPYIARHCVHICTYSMH